MHNTLFITGANRGLGLEFVKQYVQDGWQVIACCRDLANAHALNSLAKQYSRIQLCELDVGDFNQIDSVASMLAPQTINLVINNAGVYPASDFGNTDYEAWSQAFKINTMSSLKLAETFLPHMQKAGQAKFLALTSKMGSIEDNTSGSEYSYRSSKTALNMVIKSLSIDLAEFGVSVAALHPGWVRTDMGGPNGLIDADTSVSGLRQVIAQLDRENSGQFFAYNGKTIAW
ncbi:MAG: SDR family oxidoreductase [Methylophilus sp.]|jgi:NAD(P)-dependent dehydrogenase (short-subunit alcohol dehydrogenase family)